LELEWSWYQWCS